MKSVLLDNSFCLRLVNKNDEFHQNVKEYFEYFLDNDVTMYLSSITFAEYCVRNNPKDFPLSNVKTLTFDLRDAAKAGNIWEFMLAQRTSEEKGMRDIIKDDCKLFAQISNRKSDAFISKDKKAYRKYILPLQKNEELSCKFDFIDLAVSFKTYFEIPPTLFD